MIIILTVLALIVVKALAEARGASSPSLHGATLRCLWAAPMRFLRPGRVRRSLRYWYRAAGGVCYFGGVIAHDPYWGPTLTFKDTTITFALIGYAFVLRCCRYG